MDSGRPGGAGKKMKKGEGNVNLHRGERERESRVCLTFTALVFCAMRRPGGNRIEEASFPPPAHTSLLNICLGQLCSWLARTNKACRRVKTCQRVAQKHRASKQDRETERDTVVIKLERERERERDGTRRRDSSSDGGTISRVWGLVMMKHTSRDAAGSDDRGCTNLHETRRGAGETLVPL